MTDFIEFARDLIAKKESFIIRFEDVGYCEFVGTYEFHHQDSETLHLKNGPVTTSEYWEVGHMTNYDWVFPRQVDLLRSRTLRSKKNAPTIRIDEYDNFIVELEGRTLVTELEGRAWEISVTDGYDYDPYEYHRESYPELYKEHQFCELPAYYWLKSHFEPCGDYIDLMEEE